MDTQEFKVISITGDIIRIERALDSRYSLVSGKKRTGIAKDTFLENLVSGCWKIIDDPKPEREFQKSSLSDAKLDQLFYSEMYPKNQRVIADAAVKQHILDQESEKKITPKEMFEKYGLGVKIPAPSSYWVRTGLPGSYWDQLSPIPTQDYGL